MLTCFWFLGLQQLLSSAGTVVLPNTIYYALKATGDKDRGNSDFRRLLISSSAACMWWHPWQHSSWMLLFSTNKTASATVELILQTHCKQNCWVTNQLHPNSSKIWMQSRWLQSEAEYSIYLPAQVEKQGSEEKAWVRSETTWLHLIRPTVIPGMT